MLRSMMRSFPERLVFERAGKLGDRGVSEEVLKGIQANAWIRFQDDEKVYEWDHEHETMADALAHAEALV